MVKNLDVSRGISYLLYELKSEYNNINKALQKLSKHNPFHEKVTESTLVNYGEDLKLIFTHSRNFGDLCSALDYFLSRCNITYSEKKNNVVSVHIKNRFQSIRKIINKMNLECLAEYQRLPFSLGSGWKKEIYERRKLLNLLGYLPVIMGLYGSHNYDISPRHLRFQIEHALKDLKEGKFGSKDQRKLKVMHQNFVKAISLEKKFMAGIEKEIKQCLTISGVIAGMIKREKMYVDQLSLFVQVDPNFLSAYYRKSNVRDIMKWLEEAGKSSLIAKKSAMGF
jgi:hypothetical protein